MSKPAPRHPRVRQDAGVSEPDRRRGTPTRLLLLAGLVVLMLGGCARLIEQNTARLGERNIRASNDAIWEVTVKCAVLVPARDIVLLEPLWRRLVGDRAWNAVGDGVDDSPFYTNRPPESLTPGRVARGPSVDRPPRPPLRIIKIKRSANRPSFLSEDATGRKYLVKLDDPDYPELGTSATIIAARIFWALGYNVPQEFLIRVEGTGDERYDGRRATASLLLDDVRGHFHFDWFRYRRELRGLRLASAWLNDVDRVGSNTLVTVTDRRATYYLIDFNSCLGSWQGGPKEPWRGWRHASSLNWAIVQVLTLGRVRPEPNPAPPVVSPAIGRFDAEHFDPLKWRPQVPNNAFEHMTRADLEWMASKIRMLDRERIAAIVAAAEYSNPQDSAYMVDTLMARRERILALVEPAP